MVNPKYTVLFGGGAIRGLAYVGTLRALEELGVEYDIIGGSSVGSILAALLACGYKSYELENLFMKINFELFRDIHFGFGKAFALSKGEVFIDWINELISRKLKGGKELKFRDLEQKLVIITTNLTEFKTQEFSNDVTPDFEIAKAIRISSSMPGLMPPYDYNGSDLVDGDLQKASPMWKLSETLNNSKNRILEFRLEGDCKNDTRNPVSFINTGDIFFADFNLDKDSRRKLIESGYEQTMRYFKEFLPKKKEKLSEVYSEILKYLKKINSGLKANEVDEVQWWLGELFITLCENKEIVDEIIYNSIVEMKNRLSSSSKRVFFFSTKFEHKRELEEQMKKLIKDVDERLTEIRFYLQKIKP